MTEIQKKKIKEERVLKLKKIGFWSLNIFCYICSFLFIILLIISLATPKKSNNTSPKNVINQIQYRLDTSEETIYPIYDDESYQITLSVEQVNNYSFSNLNSYLSNLVSTSINLNYNSSLWFPNIIDNVYEWYNERTYTFIYPKICINSNNNFVYYLTSEDLEGTRNFEYNFIFSCNSVYYEDLKTAIQADVSANQPGVNHDIFDSFTQTITNFLNTLNEGVENVINLFWNSTDNELTLLGGLTTIVIGVAVAFFLFRLLLGLIRLRG